MENFLLLLLFTVFLYAVVLMFSLGYYVASERQERLENLRNEMSNAQTKLDSIRIRSEKFWESVASE